MKHLFLIILTALFPVSLIAQDIDDLLEEATGGTTEYTTATFKSTRIINGHSIERMPEGQLDFRISHRFGQLNTGAYNLWGLDQANIHFSLEYGITDWLMIGAGRGTYEKTYDGFIKLSLLRQSKGDRNMPVSVSWFSSMAINSLKWTGTGTLDFWNRVSYVHQLLIARKFNERFSLAFNPSFIHRNLVKTELDPNDTWALGFGTRFKLTKRFSLNAEYYYVIPPENDFRSLKTYDPFSIGVDIETGGHVFTIMLTNSLAMIEKGFIGETEGDWGNAGIHLGFNISRVFALK
jgi:opacity protein-like surface antigen